MVLGKITLNMTHLTPPLIIEAPNEVYSVENHDNVQIYLGGGINGCADWRKELIKKLKDLSITIYNPRRKNFPIGDPEAIEQQISWEYNHLLNSDVLVFWFAGGSPNSTALYQLGRWGNCNDRPLFIGIDPLYDRRENIIIETALSRHEIDIVESLDDLSEQIHNLFRTDFTLGEN